MEWKSPQTGNVGSTLRDTRQVPVSAQPNRHSRGKHQTICRIRDFDTKKVEGGRESEGKEIPGNNLGCDKRAATGSLRSWYYPREGWTQRMWISKSKGYPVPKLYMSVKGRLGKCEPAWVKFDHPVLQGKRR